MKLLLVNSLVHGLIDNLDLLQTWKKVLPVINKSTL